MVHRFWQGQRGRQAAGRAFRVLLAGFAIAIGVRGVVNWPIAAMAAPQDARQEDERATLAKDKAAVKDREQTVARREKDVAAKQKTADADLERAKQEADKVTADRARLEQERFGVNGEIGENGISIGRAKVFDNRSLTLLLENLSETLRGLQVIEQDPLRKALGQLQGSQITDVARSLSVLAGGAPGVTTTREATRQDDLERKLTSGKSTEDDVEKESVEALIDRKVSEKLGLKQETTTSERTPSLPALPELMGAPGSLPAFGQNAADLLSDQVNLTYQILNLRMLLERSLSDRLLESGDSRLQAVLGFNVSIDPPRDAENSAAIVEVTVQTVDGKPVSLVSLMPQEKTYNAVAMHTRSNAFGGSAVAGMFTVGYSERRRGQVFYLYRDNDTLSFERMITKEKATTFGWQFRPVLGRKSVSPGMRQMFAVVSIPKPDDGHLNQELRVSVRTYWRKYHADTLTTSEPGRFGPWPYLRRAATLGLSEAVPNEREARRTVIGEWETVPVPTTSKYQEELAPVVEDVRWTQIDQKTAVVSVRGRNFFSGTTVAMGAAPANVVIKSTGAMDIVTPIENIGVGVPMLLGRYGQSVPLEFVAPCLPPGFEPGTKLGPAFGGQRELTIRIKCAPDTLDPQLLVFADGKRVPGLPQIRKDESDPNASFVFVHVPVELFPKGDGMLTLVSPFRKRFKVEFPWYDNAYDVRRTTVQDKSVVYVIRKDGIRLDNDDTFGPGSANRWKLEAPQGMVPGTIVSNSILRFDLNAAAEGAVALYEPAAPPSAPAPAAGPAPSPAAPPPSSLPPGAPYKLVLLELPALKPKPKAAIEAVTPAALVMSQNDAPMLVFTGEKIADVSKVFIEGRAPFTTDPDSTKNTLTVHVPQEVTKVPAKNLVLQFRDGSGKLIATIPIEVRALPKPQEKAAPATQPQ
jgi:hypothetical protein